MLAWPLLNAPSEAVVVTLLQAADAPPGPGKLSAKVPVTDNTHVSVEDKTPFSFLPPETTKDVSPAVDMFGKVGSVPPLAPQRGGADVDEDIGIRPQYLFKKSNP